MPGSGDSRSEGDSLPAQCPAIEAISIAPWCGIAAAVPLAMDTDETSIASAIRNDESNFVAILVGGGVMGDNDSNSFSDPPWTLTL